LRENRRIANVIGAFNFMAQAFELEHFEIELGRSSLAGRPVMKGFWICLNKKAFLIL
jgi:hypothetical protein